ncbi:MAG: hypothetical protein Unbinned5081contig1001_33 [Prokaryotic dsDNA virus sp.]|nr:MAG: hypothetical protein Unbinned5081contig1001_33 [Prokaryotic dsDNA virus sp.]|tara:strand:- start:22277 stop:22447 length:171 start_codon:yes stop_codon:yes gene_type:complete
MPKNINIISQFLFGMVVAGYLCVAYKMAEEDRHGALVFLAVTFGFGVLGAIITFFS